MNELGITIELTTAGTEIMIYKNTIFDGCDIFIWPCHNFFHLPVVTGLQMISDFSLLCN